ncbi:MAG: Bug family tripartite tricarboxylate transporter substrate binding protein [Gemmatimonas sp.]
MTRHWLGAALLLAAFSTSPAHAQSGDFYKGKQVQIIIGSAAGGGYDAYGRIVQRHLGKHIPGNPTVIAQNMPGAGQTKAAGYIYSVAAKDGTFIAAVSPGALLVPVLGGPTIQYDPNRFQYVGSANSDVYTCVTRGDSPVQKFADAFDKEWIIGVSSGTTRDMPMALKNVLHAKLKMVAGYPGTKEISLAFERNEVQGICGFGYASLMSQYPDWIPSGKAKIILQESLKGHPDLNKAGIPLATSFAKNDEDRQVLELIYSQGIFGRPFLVAPEVAKDRVAILRKSFMETMQDPALIADAGRAKLDLDAISGDEVQALVAKVYATPERIIQRTKQALETD